MSSTARSFPDRSLPDPRDVVTCDPDLVSGAPVFTGTRVPVAVLLDHVNYGDSVDDFLVGFPSVERWQADAFLELASQGELVPYGIPQLPRERWQRPDGHPSLAVRDACRADPLGGRAARGADPREDAEPLVEGATHSRAAVSSSRCSDVRYCSRCTADASAVGRG